VTDSWRHTRQFRDLETYKLASWVPPGTPLLFCSFK